MMITSRLFCGIVLLFSLVSCVETLTPSTKQSTHILAMGDSMMAWNSTTGQSISHVVERTLGKSVLDRSVRGARMLYSLPVSGSLGLNISEQYIDGQWDWVIMNGGGNDFWLRCGCGVNRCKSTLHQLISKDATTGQVPTIIRKLRSKKAKVVFLGYLRTPGRNSPVDHCRAVGDEYEKRLQTMAARDPGVFYISNRDVVPHGELIYHALDRIHPSPKGSAVMGRRAAQVIRSNGGVRDKLITLGKPKPTKTDKPLTRSIQTNNKGQRVIILEPLVSPAQN